MSHPDPDQTHREWREGADREKAPRSARELLDAMRSDTELPIDTKIELAIAAIEPLVDSSDRHPMIVYAALRQLAKELQEAERTHRLSTDKRWRRRVEVTQLKARALHCDGNSKAAFGQAMAAFVAIEDLAGGPEGLQRRLRHSTPNLISELTHTILGVLAASLRRTPMSAGARNVWINVMRDTVDALTRNDITNVHPYRHSGALVQVLYLFCELGEPRDAARVDFLLKLDKRARPTDMRGQATVGLRDAAVAAYYGKFAEARVLGDKARNTLGMSDLDRHLTNVDKYGYLNFPDEESSANS